MATNGEAGTPGAPSLPDASHRWRCSGCGNLTRFDVLRTAQTQEYWHVDLSGHSVVEEVQVVGARLHSVTCRWCGRSDAIEIVDRPAAAP